MHLKTIDNKNKELEDVKSKFENARNDIDAHKSEIRAKENNA